MGLLSTLKNLFTSRWPSKVKQTPGVPMPPPSPGPRMQRRMGLPTTAPQPTGAGHRGWTGRYIPPESTSFDQGGEELTLDETEDFLTGDLAQFVTSSWLSYIRYLPDEEELEVGFLDGAAVIVSEIDHHMAFSIARAYSKGRWYWDHVLVRGKGNKGKTQRPVRQIRGAAPVSSVHKAKMGILVSAGVGTHHKKATLKTGLKTPTTKTPGQRAKANWRRNRP